MTSSSAPRTLAVLTGGYSAEAPVSRKSAAMVMAHIDRTRWQPILIDITPSGWAVADGRGTTLNRADFTLHHPDGSIQPFDGALVMVHGTPGEDGQIQAYLDLLAIPHTNGSPRSMALTFHKGWTTTLLRSAGIRVADSVMLQAGDPIDHQAITDHVGGFPCFVKPNEAGSSFGVSRVASAEELPQAIATAFAACHGPGGILIEALLPGREFSVGVIPGAPSPSDSDNPPSPEALPVTEIISEADFFDYAAKYEGASQEITPAHIPEAIAAEMQALALRVYHITECRGLARVDMKWSEAEMDLGPAVIEINSVPGFTEHSLVPQQAEHAGISRMELINRILSVQQ